jgi:tetratricopeptide (TPR) repeat protein
VVKNLLVPVLFFISFFSCNTTDSVNSVLYSEQEVMGLKQTIDSCLSANNYSAYINSQIKLAQIYKEADSLAEWLYCYDRIIKISRDDISLDTAIKFYKIVNDQIWRMPTDTQSLNKLAWIHRQIAYEFGPKLQQWKLCIPYYQLGIELIDQSGNWTSDKAIKFLKPCGSAFTRIGEPQNAVGYLKKSYSICQQFSDTINMLKSLNDLGIAYYDISKFEEALNVYHKALAINHNGQYQEELFGTYSKLTTYYLEQHTIDSADHYLKLLQLSISKNTETDDLADYYCKMAKYQFLTKDYKQAKANYLKGIETFLNSTESRKREAAKTQIELGNMHLFLQNYNDAILAYHEALKLVATNFIEMDVSKPLNDNVVFVENTILEASVGKGDAFFALYTKNKSIEYLTVAISQYESALRVANSIANSYELESSKIKLSEKTLDINNKLSIATSTFTALKQ